LDDDDPYYLLAPRWCIVRAGEVIVDFCACEFGGAMCDIFGGAMFDGAMAKI
jgi:hypothetical protein